MDLKRVRIGDRQERIEVIWRRASHIICRIVPCGCTLLPDLVSCHRIALIIVAKDQLWSDLDLFFNWIHQIDHISRSSFNINLEVSTTVLVANSEVVVKWRLLVILW